MLYHKLLRPGPEPDYPQEATTIISSSELVAECFSACFKGNIKELSELLHTNNLHVNTVRTADGETLLAFAVNQCCKAEMLKFLLSQPGIDVSLENDNGRTALDNLLSYGVTKQNCALARKLIRLGVNIDKINKNQTGYLFTYLFNAWICKKPEEAKLLIQLGAKLEFSEALFDQTILRASENKKVDEYSHQERIDAMTAEASWIPEQINLSKQFVKEFVEEIDKVKWLGVAVACISFQRYIEHSLLVRFLLGTSQKESMAATEVVDKESMREAYILGYGMMRNRLIKGQYDSCSFFSKETVPPPLLFRAQVEHREKELANEICWQQWQNNYYSNFPNRKDQPGYGPGAMVVAKCGR